MTTYQASPGVGVGIGWSQGRAGGRERKGKEGERERWAGQEGPATPTPGPRNVPTLTKKTKKEIARVTFFPFKKFI